METLKAGDKRLISYAVDLGTRITEAFGSKQAVVREIHANRGMLTTKVAAEETRTYTVRNVDQKAKTLIIEHPLRPGYTLLSQKPTEKTATAYRFEMPLAARRHTGIRRQRRARLRPVHRRHQPDPRHPRELLCKTVRSATPAAANCSASRTRSARSPKTIARCRMSTPRRAT